jgi:phthiodiolone/phenolphthiodiolone dimycocerosates ketoreductase
MYVIAKPPLEVIEQLAKTAEDLQLDSVFVWDHIQDLVPTAIWDEHFSWVAAPGSSPHEWLEWQTLLGYLAGRTSRLRFGVGVTEPIRRHPIILAQAMLTLAHLSPRAPILGIGAGERENTEPYGLKLAHSVNRLEEALQIIRIAFTSRGPLDFNGKFFQLNGAVIDLLPPAGKTPQIWIAAHGPRMLQLTGRYGDGWYPIVVGPPEDYAARLGVIRRAAEEADRDPNAITPAFHPVVVVAPTESEARAMLGAKAIRFLGLMFPDEVWRLFGLTHPFGEGSRGYIDILPETFSRAAIERAIAMVPPAMMELALWGTPEQVLAKLRAYGDAGLRYVVPVVASAAVSPQMAGFGIEALGEISRALNGGATEKSRSLASA